MVDNGSLSGPLHIQTEAQAEAIAEQTIGNNVILSFIFNNKELKKKDYSWNIFVYAKLAYTKFLGIANEGLVWVEVWFIIKGIGAQIWSICYVLFTVLWGWSMNDLNTFEFRWEVVCCICMHWNLWKPTCGTSKIFVIIVHCYNNFVLKTWGGGGVGVVNSLIDHGEMWCQN